jgi:hypothetical protein
VPRRRQERSEPPIRYAARECASINRFHRSAPARAFKAISSKGQGYLVHEYRRRVHSVCPGSTYLGMFFSCCGVILAVSGPEHLSDRAALVLYRLHSSEAFHRRVDHCLHNSMPFPFSRKTSRTDGARTPGPTQLGSLGNSRAPSAKRAAPSRSRLPSWPKLQAFQPRRHTKADLTLHAQRLQRDGIVRSTNQHVSAGAEANRCAGVGAGILAG